MQVQRFLHAYCGAWIILCQFTGPSNAKLLPSQAEQNRAVPKLLLQLKQEKDYDSLVILNQYDGPCGDEQFDGDTTTPTILLHRREGSYLKENVNSKILMLVCLSFDVEQSFMEGVAAKLRYMRLTRIVFLWKQTELLLSHRMREVEKLARLCDSFDMLNVIFLFKDFAVHHKLYSFSRFPRFELESRQLLNSTNIFARRLHDRHRKPLTAASSYIQPRAMEYKTGNGTLVSTGYLVKFAIEFAKRLNSTLFIRPHNGHVLQDHELFVLTRNKTIDFALATVKFEFRGGRHELSSTFELMDYLVMLPVESQISKNRMFFSMLGERSVNLGLIVLLVSLSFLLSTNVRGKVRHQVHKLDYICSERVLRGLLAQSTPLPTSHTYNQTVTCGLLLFSGFMLSNTYWSFLNSYLVELPLERRIQSYDDLLQSKTKICVPSMEVATIIFHKGADFWSKYENAFEVIDYKEFTERRLYLNTSCGYTVTAAMWYIIERAQSSLQRKLFRLPPVETGMHFRMQMVKMIPIPENFVHKEALDFYISCAWESGLLRLWIEQSYADIKKASSFVSRILPRDTHVYTLELNAFYWVFILLLLGNAVAILVFAIELLVAKWQHRKVQNQWIGAVINS